MTEALYKELLYKEEEVDAAIDDMAADIVHDFDRRSTLFVSLLNGANPFMAKLMFAIQRNDAGFHPNVQSMIVSRYGAERQASELRLVTDLPPKYRQLQGRHILLLDDLIDGGDTLAFAKAHLLSYGAESVEYAVLVKKIKDPPVDVDIRFCFEAPDVWLTGMGMDDSRLAPEGNHWAGWIAIACD